MYFWVCAVFLGFLDFWHTLVLLGRRGYIWASAGFFVGVQILLGTHWSFWARAGTFGLRVFYFYFFFGASGYFWAQGFFCHTQVLLGALLVLTTHIFFGTRDDEDDDFDDSDYGNDDGDDYGNDDGNDDENDDGNDDGNGDGNHNGDDDENDDGNNDDDIWHKKFLEIY